MQLPFFTTLGTGLGLFQGWMVLLHLSLSSVVSSEENSNFSFKNYLKLSKMLCYLCVSSYPEVQRFELSDKVVLPSENSSLMCLILLCPKLEVTFENRLLFVIISGLK